MNYPPSYNKEVQYSFLSYLEKLRKSMPENSLAQKAMDGSALHVLSISEAMECLLIAIGQEAFLRFQKGPLEDGLHYYVSYRMHVCETAPYVHKINDGWLIIYHPDISQINEYATFRFDRDYTGPAPSADDIDNVFSLLQLVS